MWSWCRFRQDRPRAAAEPDTRTRHCKRLPRLGYCRRGWLEPREARSRRRNRSIPSWTAQAKAALLGCVPRLRPKSGEKLWGRESRIGRSRYHSPEAYCYSESRRASGRTSCPCWPRPFARACASSMSRRGSCAFKSGPLQLRSDPRNDGRCESSLVRRRFRPGSRKSLPRSRMRT